MKVSKIELNGEFRIMVEFPYNQHTANLIRQISDVQWNNQLKAWHIPYQKKELAQLKALFPDLEYPTRQTANKPEDAIPIACPSVKPEKCHKIQDVTIQVIGRRIILKLPKNVLDIHFIKSLRFSHWDGKQFFWVIPNYPGNLDLINDYFKGRIRELIVHEDYSVNTNANTERKIRKNELLIIKTVTGRLKLIYAFNNQLTFTIKKMPYCNWDSKNKWWTIPFSEKFLHEIKTIAGANGFEIVYEEEIVHAEEKTKRISPYDIPNYRQCPDEYIRKLQELRYSNHTIKTYKGLFEEYINYYHKFDIQHIDEKMIIAFLQYLVLERKVSVSYQNQSINSIKFYYERILGGNRKIYMVERPRREKQLPVVLNEQEITNTIRQVTNTKHKAIIMITYSSGLRLSEVINLKLKDIDSKRMQVFVRQAKGRKDRYTLLSKKVIPVLRDYFKEYKPKVWLFEGAKGQQYSESSVQAVVKDAYRKAGIKKKASTHTLRHCFGTHLLENGTDLRYIQALMGHESSKTTEIYTHITTKGFDQIENPLDKLEI